MAVLVLHQQFDLVLPVPRLAGLSLCLPPHPLKVMAARVGPCLLMQNLLEQHQYRSWPGPRQLLVQVEQKLLPSLAVLVQDHFGLVRAEPPLAGQRLRQSWKVLVEPVPRWMTLLLMEQPPCQRLLPVQIEPKLLPSLAALAMHRFALVLAVKPMAGQRQRRPPLPWRVMAAWALGLLMQIQMFQVYRHLYRSLAGKRQLPVQVEPELLPSLAVLVQDHFGLVRAEPPLAGQQLRLRRPPLLGWMTAARALGLLM